MPNSEFNRAWVMLNRNGMSREACSAIDRYLARMTVAESHEKRLQNNCALVFSKSNLFGPYDIMLGIVATNLYFLNYEISKVEENNKELVRSTETFIVVPESEVNGNGVLGNPFAWREATGNRKMIVGIDVASTIQPRDVQRSLREKIRQLYGREFQSVAIDMVFGRYDIMLVAGIIVHTLPHETVTQVRDLLRGTEGISKTETMFTHDFFGPIH